MPWVIVPLDRKDFGYFDRQRDLFSDWRHLFDDTWRDLGLEDSQERFNRELDRVRDDMHRMDVQPVVLDVQHPFIIDPEGNHKFCLRFNCSQFKPEEIEVKTMDNTLKVHAKHVQETESRKIHQEFTREYALPENVDPNKLKSHLSEDGVLQIEAPVPPPPEVKAPKEILIPIQHLESKKKPKKAAEESKNGEKEPKEGEKEPKEDEKEPKGSEKETKEEGTESEKEPKEGENETKEDETEPKEGEKEPKEDEKETKEEGTESEKESKEGEKRTKEDETEPKEGEKEPKEGEKKTKEEGTEK